MLKLHFLSLLFSIVFTSFGQYHTTTEAVYFDTDKWHLRPDALSTLKSFTDSLHTLHIDSIYVSGNTDSRASNEYNIALSQKRTHQITDFLTSAGFENTPVRLNFYGEEKPLVANTDDQNMQKNRRVDIIVYYTVTTLPVKDTILPKDPCLKDTTIRLENGTELVFNKCEYLDKKDCFELTEVVNVTDALSNDMTTVDDQGNPLASGGMIGLNPLRSAQCENLCFEHKIRVRFPIPEDPFCQPCSGSSRLYDADENGNWNQTDEALKIVKIDGINYYEFELSPCWRGFKNVDCKIPSYNVKFKAPPGYDFIHLTVSSGCPFTVYNLTHENEWRDRIIKKRKMPCYMGNADIQGYFKNRNGDTLVLHQRPMETLDKYIWFARCKSKKEAIERNIFGIFPYKKRALYRKYHIKKEDLVPLE